MANQILPPQEYLRECFDYNPETGAMSWRSRPQRHFATLNAYSSWNSQNAGNRLSHIQGRYRASVDGKRYRSNRIIWKWMTGEEPPETVDHANGDTLDDRWENLRAATKQENCRNQRGWKNRKHKLPKGVYLNKDGYFSMIRVAGKYVYLGSFKKAKDAHTAYCAAAKKHYGEFANSGH